MSISGVSLGRLGTYSIIWRSAQDAASFDTTDTLVGLVFWGQSSASGSGRGGGTVAVTGSRVQAPSHSQLYQAAVAALPPPGPPPVPTYSRGPKGAGITLSNYRRTATATGPAAQAVFHRWGFAAVAGAKTYWEFVADAYAATLGGFGVGEVYTAVDSAPGKADNPGCMMYLESGSLSIWNNGTETAIGALAAGTRFGVGAHFVGPSTVDLVFYVNGVLKGSARYLFDGPMWIPTLCTLSTTPFDVHQSTDALAFCPAGYVPLAQYTGTRFDFERRCVDVPTDTPLVTIQWPSDINESQSVYSNPGPLSYYNFIYNPSTRCKLLNPGSMQCGLFVHNRGVIAGVLEEWHPFNSQYEYEHEGEIISLTGIRIRTDNTVPIGAGRFTDQYGAEQGYLTGIGAAPAWELPGNYSSSCRLADAWFSVLIVQFGEDPFNDPTKYFYGKTRVWGDIEEGWYTVGSTATRPTPVDLSIDVLTLYECELQDPEDISSLLPVTIVTEPIIIKPMQTYTHPEYGDMEIGDYIDFRLFQDPYRSSGDGSDPDIIYAPITIDLYGESA